MVPLETCSRQDQFCLITCYIFNLSTLYHYIYILHTTVYHLSTLLYWAAQNILLYVFIKIYLFIRMCVCLISIYVHFVFGYSFVFLHWVCQDLVVQGCVLLWVRVLCFLFVWFFFSHCSLSSFPYSMLVLMQSSDTGGSDAPSSGWETSVVFFFFQLVREANDLHKKFFAKGKGLFKMWVMLRGWEATGYKLLFLSGSSSIPLHPFLIPLILNFQAHLIPYVEIFLKWYVLLKYQSGWHKIRVGNFSMNLLSGKCSSFLNAFQPKQMAASKPFE